MWGYHAHKAGVSIEIVQAKYMHSSTDANWYHLGIERIDVMHTTESIYKKIVSTTISYYFPNQYVMLM